MLSVCDWLTPKQNHCGRGRVEESCSTHVVQEAEKREELEMKGPGTRCTPLDPAPLTQPDMPRMCPTNLQLSLKSMKLIVKMNHHRPCARCWTNRWITWSFLYRTAQNSDPNIVCSKNAVLGMLPLGHVAATVKTKKGYFMVFASWAEIRVALKSWGTDCRTRHWSMQFYGMVVWFC